MSGLTLKKILTASLLISSSANANSPLHDKGLRNFAESFYVTGMYEPEKARVDRALSKVAPDKRNDFIKAFQQINSNLSSAFYCDGILESLTRLDPADWRNFEKFIDRLLPAVVTPNGSLYGAPFARIITNVAYVEPKDREAFLELVHQYVKPEYSIDDNSWLVAKLGRIHRENYDRISELLKEFITPKMSAYDRSLFIVPLDRVKKGDTDALTRARKYISEGLSAEHQSSIINAFATMPMAERVDFTVMIDTLAKEQDQNYVAWLVQSLSRVPLEWRQEAANKIASDSEVKSYELWDKMIEFIVDKKRDHKASS